jgi:hypothetical protein
MTMALLQRQVGHLLHQFQHHSSCFFNGDRHRPMSGLASKLPVTNCLAAARLTTWITLADRSNTPSPASCAQEGHKILIFIVNPFDSQKMETA